MRFLASVPLVTLAHDIAIAQEEIAPFKLADVSAEFVVRYLLDDREFGQGLTRSTLLKEQIKFRTRSYVYHPALLDMRIAGGPIFLQGSYGQDQDSNRESETLFDFDARFKFLSRKKYPFSVYVAREHAEMTTRLLGRFLARTDTFDISGSIRPSKVPLSSHWNVSHVTATGSGFGAAVDETVDGASFATSLAYMAGQNLKLNVDWSERLSRSGSAGLPIQESLIEILGANLVGQNTFGGQRQLTLRQNLRLLQQDTTAINASEIERLSYNGNLKWLLTERLDTNVSYIHRDEDRTSSWSRSHDGRIASTFKATDRLTMVGSGQISQTENPGFVLDRKGVNASAVYRQRLKFADFTVSGSLAYDRTDQSAAVDTIRVFDERHALTGVLPVPLNSAFVLTDTVVVTNDSQTQTFLQDLDYRLVTIGSTTTIERIVTGNIFDGQEVLVSYEYQAGGTAEYDTQAQSIGLSLSFNKYASVYLNINNSDNVVLSGFSTVPLNDRKSFELGTSLGFPLGQGWSVDGHARFRKQVENISPHESVSYNVSAQTGQYFGTSVQFGFNLETVDNELSDEDVDLSRYFVSLAWRLPGAARLTYRYVTGEDDGGSVVRKDTSQDLQLDWRYRQVQLVLRARRANTEQGASSRDDTRVMAELRRAF